MIDVIWGAAKDKPVSTRRLAELLSKDEEFVGYLYLGYPVMGSPTGPVRFDALFVSRQVGIVAFDLVEGLEIGDYKARQDEIATMLEVRLKPYAQLKKGRQLKFPINVVTFAPAKNNVPASEAPYYIANGNSLNSTIDEFEWPSDSHTYTSLVAAVQVVTSIRAGRQPREPKFPNSKGARLKRVEESIANLDQHQSRAVIETVEGVQRIRGLAGSGKTIVLALKVAYLHANNDDWRIAVTFNTRSLKDQFIRLINNFTIEQAGSEPNWDRIDVLNAWGGPGAKERDGIYHKYCREHGIPFLDFRAARAKFGEAREFSGACREALATTTEPHPYYDLILVDEAQDLPPEFLRLCYRFLREPKRLVYAYDELQSLTGESVLPPEELFGKDAEGRPIVQLQPDDGASARQDIILEKCYRNPRPVLASAHALGFGIYRDNGLVQLFDQDSLWSDVGYAVVKGDLKGGHDVTLARTPETSPRFLEDHSPLSDLIQFLTFSDSNAQAEWLAKAIERDITEEELRPEDIVVINPNPLTTQKEVAPVRAKLFELGINSEIAGVSTSADVFTRSGAITFTGIFRAKGNEAGMVYIINAQDCFYSYSAARLALVRNRLFTAITRSKAWVRVLGIGPGMERLTEEWQRLAKNDFQLQFKYPTDEQKLTLRLINKELPREARLERAATSELIAAVERGELDPDDLIELLSELKRVKKKRK